MRTQLKVLVKMLVLVAGLLVSGNAWGQGSNGLTAAQLLAQLDRNEAGTSSHFVGAITVEDRFGTKTSGFESWSLGNDQSLVEFTSGEEKGQKILRKGETLYVAYPEADKPVKLQGAALKESVAGSDFSYEDMAGDKSYASRYEAKIVGEEAASGEPCVVLELKAKKTGLAYPLLKVWMAVSDASVRKMEKYSLNGRLLKTQEVLAVLNSAGRTIPSHVVMTDALKTKSKTTFTVARAELDGRVDAQRFSLEELTW